MKKLVVGLVAASMLALATSGVMADAPYQLLKAPGQYCKAAGASKKKAKGVKGKTPFAQCVTAVAKVNKNNDIAPASACKGVSKKHYPGMKRTPFAACTSAVKNAKNDLG